jgi:hypothetical protein
LWHRALRAYFLRFYRIYMWRIMSEYGIIKQETPNPSRIGER